MPQIEKCKRLIYNLIHIKPMRKFYWMLAALMLASVSFVACNDKDPQPQPGPDPTPTPTPTELTFEISVSDVTRTSAFINVTPSDLEADYFSVIYNAYSVEQCATDAEIVAKIYDEIKAYAESVDQTFVDYMADHVKRGKQENLEVGGLTHSTNYYLLVFGVDSTKEYAASTEIEMVRFKTAQPEQSTCTFELKTSVYLTSAAINVKPSDANQVWHLINLSVDEYDAYTSADGEYGWSNQELFQNTLNTEIETLKSEGLSNDEIGVKLFHKGMRTLNVAGLEAKTQYTAFAAGVTYEDGEAYITTTPKEIRYRSGEAAKSDLSFDVNITNIEHFSADVLITPSDLDAEYYYYIGFINSAKKSMKPIDIATSAITEYIYYWDNNELKYREPSKGVVDLTGDNSVELSIAETEYYIVAFSFEPNPNYGKLVNEETGEYDTNPGNITSAPVYVSFMTANHGDPMNAEFSFKASDIGPYDFTFEVDASDASVYYQPGIAYADNFTPEAAIAASADQLALVMQMCMEGQSPCLTYQEAIDRLKQQGYPYRNGDGKYYVANLDPEREYIGYVLAIDMKTGKFARCYYSDVIAKTTAIGDVTPGVEILGVYNGNDENGTIFGDADFTVGRPIVAVRLTGVENASAAFAALTSDPYADVLALSDRYIIANMRGYWQELTSLSVPYHFFIADWDLEQTIVAYAQDANGLEAGVGAVGVTPSTSGDIEQLRAYVNEVNNAVPKAATRSLVINDVAEPMITCIWNEEVELPSAGYVKYHEVEPLQSVASDLVSVKVVKSFAL